MATSQGIYSSPLALDVKFLGQQVMTMVRSGIWIFLFGLFQILTGTLLAREWQDASGKFKVEGELVTIRSGKVVIEKTDGTIIGVPLEKLCEADQKFAKSQSNVATPQAPAPGGENGASPAEAPHVVAGDPSSLASAVQATLHANCYRCHGEGGTSEGGFNFVQDLEKISKTLVTPKNSSASLLWHRLTAGDDGVMPPPGESPRPSPADIATIKRWIDDGCAVPAHATSRDFISNEQIAKLMHADVQKMDERSRRFVRYFTLSHLYNAGVSEDELQTYRNAFKKLINSLSWNIDVVIPTALDQQQTLFRVDMRQVSWDSALWQQIEAASPYFVATSASEMNSVCESTQCRIPCIRVDWFVFAASKPPLYHTMLNLPQSAGELENLLRVNVATNIDQEQAIRAGFNRSGVSQNNRLIEWHRSSYGSYWKSYDFASNVGRQNLFEYPLGPGSGAAQFQHDGGELIFTLPNGLQGYLLVTGEGKRIDRGPTNIVSDPKSADKSVVNGVSCMSCHFAGVVIKADEVGPAVKAHRKAFAEADTILALYHKPDELNNAFSADAKRFAAAMQKLGINNLSRSGEPISVMSHRFEQELDAPMAATEFGLSAEQFFKCLDKSDTMSRRFAALRNSGGVIKRDVFASAFGEAALDFKLVKKLPLPPDADQSVSIARTEPRSTPSARAKKGASVEKDSANNEDWIWPQSGMTHVNCLAFSPNSDWLAVGGSSPLVTMYNVAQRSQIDSKDRSKVLGAAARLAFTPDGKRLLVGGNSGPVGVFEVRADGTLNELGQFAGHTREIASIAISGDGKVALTSSKDSRNSLRVWEIDSLKELDAFGQTKFGGEYRCTFLSKDGKSGFASDGKDLTEWAFAGKAQVKSQKVLSQFGMPGSGIALSSDGSQLVLSEFQGIRVWNLKNFRELPKIETQNLFQSIALTSDGTRMVGSDSNGVEIWDLRKGRRVKTQDVPDGGHVTSIAISPDKKHVAAGGFNCLFVFRLPPLTP